jgi:Na+-transporting methylmalonyl-CoA/oxaloacetate decarboxylase gamma subunit
MFQRLSLLAAVVLAVSLLSATVVPPERAAKSICEKAAVESKDEVAKNVAAAGAQAAPSTELAKNHGTGKLTGHTAPDSNSIRRLLRGILL